MTETRIKTVLATFIAICGVFLATQSDGPTASDAVLWIALIWCSITDVVSMKIPNRVTYSCLVVALAINLGASVARAYGIETAAWGIGLSASFTGAIACFSLTFLIYRVIGMGAGDVKLCTVIGATIGVEAGLLSLASALLLGGCAAICIYIVHVGAGRLIVSLFRVVGNLLFPMWVSPPENDFRSIGARALPLAPFLTLGTLFVIRS